MNNDPADSVNLETLNDDNETKAATAVQSTAMNDAQNSQLPTTSSEIPVTSSEAPSTSNLATLLSPHNQEQATVPVAATETRGTEPIGLNNDSIISITANVNNADSERTCWICFSTDEDNRLAAWVKPCKCRGTTKWVHQSCLYRWIDEKQRGNAMRTVTCQQCQTEYIIVFPQMTKVANLLETFDNIIKRMSPFLTAGIFVGSLYWTAVTYGAVTFLQVVGHKKGLILMENGDPLILLIGLPAIPVALVLGRMIRWEDAVMRLIRNRNNVVRKFPLVNFMVPHAGEEEEEPAGILHNPPTPALTDSISATRIFCGALLLPTISSLVGRLLYDSIENTLHRTLLGGLTFITVKGILKIYLKQQQFTRKKRRRIIDYTEENVRFFATRPSARQNPNSQPFGANAGGAEDAGGAAAADNNQGPGTVTSVIIALQNQPSSPVQITPRSPPDIVDVQI